MDASSFTTTVAVGWSSEDVPPSMCVSPQLLAVPCTKASVCDKGGAGGGRRKSGTGDVGGRGGRNLRGGGGHGGEGGGGGSGGGCGGGGSGHGGADGGLQSILRPSCLPCTMKCW